MTLALTYARTGVLLVVCACALLAPGPRPASADVWYVPVTDPEPGGFDHIQILMASGYTFQSPAMTAFSGPDATGEPSPQSEQWAQTFLNCTRHFATADGPADGYEFLAFTIWVDGNRQIDRPVFFYQTYLDSALVGNWVVICTGPAELDWRTVGAWGATRQYPPWTPGDADQDTDVDGDDFVTLAVNYTGTGGTDKAWNTADFDGDGDVDGDDFVALAVHYTGTIAAPVPEPASLLLMGVGAAVVARRRGRST